MGNSSYRAIKKELASVDKRIDSKIIIFCCQSFYHAMVKEGREIDFDNELFERMQAELNLSLKRLGRNGVGGFSYSDSALSSYIGDDRELRIKCTKK